MAATSLPMPSKEHERSRRATNLACRSAALMKLQPGLLHILSISGLERETHAVSTHAAQAYTLRHVVTDVRTRWLRDETPDQTLPGPLRAWQVLGYYYT